MRFNIVLCICGSLIFQHWRGGVFIYYNGIFTLSVEENGSQSPGRKMKEDEIPEGLLNMKKISITLLCEIVPAALCSHLLNITIHVNEV